jgi:hemolysin activation/secretion protein
MFRWSHLLPFAPLLVALPAGAQTPPDAGRTLRDLERPAATPPRPAPALALPTDAAGEADRAVRFVVREVRLDGGEAVGAAALGAELAALAGREVSLADLQNEARRLTQQLREAGFALARVVIPAQEIRDGVVYLQVLDGRLGRAATDNQSRVDGERFERIVLAQVTPGEPLRTEALDRALLLAADLPGAGTVAGSLAPGDRVGTSDLTVTVAPGPGYEGEVTADNYGNRYTGQQRLGLRLDANSPAGMGDRLRVNLTASDQALYYGRLAYDLPVGHDGLRLGAALAQSRYDLGKEFAALDAHGTADTASLYGSYPLVRSRGANLYLGASLEHRKLQDRIDSTDTVTDKSADVLVLSVDGDKMDGFAGGGVFQGRLAVSGGRLAIDTPAAKALDAAGPQTTGGYAKGQASLSRLQSLGTATRLYAGVQGQWAGKNLDSSEKFTLGGAYGVRAYPQGEGVGDEGLLAILELRRDLAAGLEAKAFYDWGSVRINRTNYAAAANSLTLAGYGLGAQWSAGGFFVSAAVAWRDRQPAVSAPDKSPRAWLLAGWRF